MVRSLVWGVDAEGGVRGFQQAKGAQAHCRCGSGLRVPETDQHPGTSENGALRAWKVGIRISAGKWRVMVTLYPENRLCPFHMFMEYL